MKARRNARTEDGAQLKPMTPAEKSILITKAVANCHEVLLKYGACKCAFHETATLLPVSHIEHDKSSASKDQDCAHEELEVSLQHLPEYKYIEQCPKSKVLEEVNTLKCKEEDERKERQQYEADEACVREIEERMIAPFIRKAADMFSRLEEHVFVNIADEADKIHATTGLVNFVIGGSHVSLRMSDTYAELKNIKVDVALEIVPLVSNDKER